MSMPIAKKKELVSEVKLKTEALRHFKIGSVLKTTATFYRSRSMCGIRTELLNLGAPIGGLG